jgi:hypothetical protein
MRKLIIILLLVNISLTAERIDTYKIRAFINIVDRNGRTEVLGTQNAKGFITGVLYRIDTVKFIGSANVFDFNFLEEFSKEYEHRENNSTVNAGDTPDNTPDDYFHNYADRIVQYSFYPEKVSAGDSLLSLYCKYILYEKKKEISANMFNYDISFHECFYTVPINKKISLDFLKELFPKATINEVTFSLDNVIYKKEQPSLNLSRYMLSEKDIKQSVKKDMVTDSSIHFQAEYLCLDKNGDKVFTRSKFKCPSEINRICTDSVDMQEFPLTVYKGSASIPFQMYNPLKEDLYAKSKKYKNSIITYSILAIPLDKRGNKYDFNILITRSLWGSEWTYSKKIEVEVGKPLRIDLETSAGLIRTDETIDGQIFKLYSKEDFSDYVNEYFVISVVKSK